MKKNKKVKTKKIKDNILTKKQKDIDFIDSINTTGNIFLGYTPPPTLNDILVRIAVALEGIRGPLEMIALLKGCEHKPNPYYRPCLNCGIKVIKPEDEKENNGK